MSSWLRKRLALCCGAALSLGLVGLTATKSKAQSETPNEVSAGSVHSHNEVCRGNLREIHRALTHYVKTNQKFPHADNWTESLKPLVSSHDVFHCPSAPGGQWGYALNERLSEKKLSQVPAPHVTNAVHETSDLRPNVSGKGDNMAHRHQTTQPKPTLSHAVTVHGRVDYAKSSRKPHFNLVPPAKH
ncbi:hypothetical protein EON80_11575 [bacterium]|nr:MAG: hypothetical protein EON80_11575 [bacterium]